MCCHVFVYVFYGSLLDAATILSGRKADPPPGAGQYNFIAPLNQPPISAQLCKSRFFELLNAGAGNTVYLGNLPLSLVPIIPTSDNIRFALRQFLKSFFNSCVQLFSEYGFLRRLNITSCGLILLHITQSGPAG